MQVQRLVSKTSGGDFDLHGLFDRDLAGEPIALERFLAGDVAALDRQDTPAPLVDLDGTQRAGAAPSAGRGDEDPLIGETIQQFSTRLSGEGFLAVDRDGEVPAGHQLGPDPHDPGHHRDEDGGEERDS